MSLRVLFFVFLAAGAPTSATPPCEGEACGAQEDAALLQSGLRRDEGSAPTCDNGHPHPEAAVCVCNAGWGGPTCSVASELTKAGEGGRRAPGDVVCGFGFTVYPYDQPDLWGSAYDSWEDCNGDVQSPIRLSKLAATERERQRGGLDYDYSTVVDPVYVLNTGNSLKLNGAWGSVTLTDADDISETFYALQFHFHSPSESVLNGRQLPMEIHMVHQSGAGNFAVVGILFEVGLLPHPCLGEVLGDPAPKAGCDKEVTPFNFGECFEDQLSGNWFNFPGSLTTPPCTEGINFNIMQKTATISFQQLRTYRSVLRNNARPVQPRNGRTVTLWKARR